MSFIINEDLKSQLRTVNLQLKRMYSSAAALDKEKFRHFVAEEIGKFGRLEKMSSKTLKELVGGKAIIGVDGSINQTAGSYPHYLAVLQALAKSTVGDYQVWKTAVHVPLLKAERERLEGLRAGNKDIASIFLDSKVKDIKLAALELAAAFQAAREMKPFLIMFDGPLRRYQTRVPEEWTDFVQYILRENILVVGVIEEVGTYLISGALKESYPYLEGQYDRELLFGQLDPGEYLEIDEEKVQRGDLRICFLRTSSDPQIIGLDMLKGQFSCFEAVSNLIYTLTPQDGRGIPIWLDLVDSEVRITQSMLDLLVDTYLDPELKRKLFAPKREERIY